MLSHTQETNTVISVFLQMAHLQVKVKAKKDLNENEAKKKMEEKIASLESELETKVQDVKSWQQTIHEQVRVMTNEIKCY